MEKDLSLSSQIYKSRDEIRSQIIEYMNTYLELENVDLTKSSFLSFIVNTLSTITSNLIFYQSSVYREFFLTKAQLTESVFDLASFLGYEPKRAEPAETDVLFTVPLEFDSNDVTFEIPFNYKCSAGNVEFRTDRKATVNVKNNTDVQITVEKDNTVYNLPVIIDTTSANEFYFVLPIKQEKQSEQEFQIDQDLKRYQFVNIDVPIENTISDLKVFIRHPDSSEEQEYKEESSLYLLGPEDRGFVSRNSDEGIVLYFGNGLIGHQPEPGSTVLVELTETKGSDGNVIPGSISSGQRLVTNEGQVLDYSITNTISATGGEDEESLEEIRHNAINHITSLDRLVTERDYKNFSSITENKILTNVLPLLKRSDLKINEIQLFTVLYYGEELVPTKNLVVETNELNIPRGTIITDDNDIDYIILFELDIDKINRYAKYQYILNSLTTNPILSRTYDRDYNFIAPELKIYKDNDQAVFELDYESDESDSDNLECRLRILNMDTSLDMTNDHDNKKFTLSTDYQNLGNGQLNLQFTISNDNDLISSYTSDVTFKQNLKDSMYSNVSVTDSTNSDEYMVYDVPAVRKSYYDDIDKEDFELNILQKIVSVNFKDYRMLTDFNNLKFADTFGVSSNMLKNETITSKVIDLVIESTDLPSDPEPGDRYITEIDGKIAEWTGSEWDYNEQRKNTIVYVEELDYKLIFTGREWIKPEFNIPIEIDIDVSTRTDYSGTELQLKENIIDNLLEEFDDKFGLDANIYLSELYEIVQNTEGVSYCHINKPKVDIFFDYDISDFSQQELLEYSPEYIYFDSDSISIGFR